MLEGVPGDAAGPGPPGKVGDVIHVGDCIEWLESLPDGTADVTITDPPYSDHTHAKSLSGRKTKRAKMDRHVTLAKRDLGFASLTPAMQRDVAIELARVTKRWVLVFCDDANIATWRWDLQGAGLEVVRVCVWIKEGCSPQFTGDRPGSGAEWIVAAHRAHPNGKPKEKRWNGGGRNNVFRHPVPRGDERTHTTEKPVSLMVELVELFSDSDELILDPFAGSGSTGVACVRLGRRFDGAELDDKTAAIAIERIAAERDRSTLTARRAGQTALFSSEVVPTRAKPENGHGACDGFGGADFTGFDLDELP